MKVDAGINAVERDSGFPEVEGVIIRNPFNEKTFFDEKLSVIDVRARDTEGKWYNIEVQLQSQSSFPQRSLYYWANTYSNQLEESNEYMELDRVIAINLLNFVCFPDGGPGKGRRRIIKEEKKACKQFKGSGCSG